MGKNAKRKLKRAEAEEQIKLKEKETGEVKVLDFLPPNRLIISEECPGDPKKGFPHTSTFNIKPQEKKCKISYGVQGTFGGKVQDIPFKPLLIGVMKEELLKMKKAIESSEVTPQQLQSETVKTI